MAEQKLSSLHSSEKSIIWLRTVHKLRALSVLVEYLKNNAPLARYTALDGGLREKCKKPFKIARRVSFEA